MVLQNPLLPREDRGERSDIHHFFFFLGTSNKKEDKMNHNLIIFMFVFVKNAQTESEFNLRNGQNLYTTHTFMQVDVNIYI